MTDKLFISLHGTNGNCYGNNVFMISCTILIRRIRKLIVKMWGSETRRILGQFVLDETKLFACLWNWEIIVLDDCIRLILNLRQISSSQRKSQFIVGNLLVFKHSQVHDTDEILSTNTDRMLLGLTHVDKGYLIPLKRNSSMYYLKSLLYYSFSSLMLADCKID